MQLVLSGHWSVMISEDMKWTLSVLLVGLWLSSTVLGGQSTSVLTCIASEVNVCPYQEPAFACDGSPPPVRFPCVVTPPWPPLPCSSIRKVSIHLKLLFTDFKAPALNVSIWCVCLKYRLAKNRRIVCNKSFTRSFMVRKNVVQILCHSEIIFLPCQRTVILQWCLRLWVENCMFASREIF